MFQKTVFCSNWNYHLVPEDELKLDNNVLLLLQLFQTSKMKYIRLKVFYILEGLFKSVKSQTWCLVQIANTLFKIWLDRTVTRAKPSPLNSVALKLGNPAGMCPQLMAFGFEAHTDQRQCSHFSMVISTNASKSEYILCCWKTIKPVKFDLTSIS